jgi:L-amino acid N-acyltransferase YncA
VSAPAPIRVRPARDEDLPSVAAIYAHHVLTGLASFEIDPPDATEMAKRRAQVLALGLPYFVAEIDEYIAGYAYAAPYRSRPAYRFTLEDSIYVHPARQRMGVGSALLPALLSACEALGYRQMIAVIGDSENHPSIRLHERFGFRRVALLPSVGWKFGRWVDSVLMQRPLGAGDTREPGSE